MTTWETLTALATCLCATLIEDDLPDVCFCGIVSGAEAALDHVDSCTGDVCGMAWVRLGAAYPSAVIGVPFDQPGNCSSLLGLDVEVGIVRCAPVMDERGNPPTMEDHLAVSDLVVRDMLSARKAIVCCPGSRDWLLGPWTPLGPDGGAVGGFWTVSLQVA